ncbi:MAG: hypothetical protein DRP91_01860, partial [Candidatus Neomarinimicrobiota bacterium]
MLFTKISAENFTRSVSVEQKAQHTKASGTEYVHNYSFPEEQKNPFPFMPVRHFIKREYALKLNQSLSRSSSFILLSAGFLYL